MKIVKQGDIYLSILDPLVGQEQAGTRPVIILSGKTMNTYSSLVLGCPLTTKIKGFIYSHCIEPTEQNGLIKTSEALLVHTRSMSKKRLIKKIGFINQSDIIELKRKLILITTY